MLPGFEASIPHHGSFPNLSTCLMFVHFLWCAGSNAPRLHSPNMHGNLFVGTPFSFDVRNITMSFQSEVAFVFSSRTHWVRILINPFTSFTSFLFLNVFILIHSDSFSSQPVGYLTPSPPVERRSVHRSNASRLVGPLLVSSSAFGFRVSLRRVPRLQSQRGRRPGLAEPRVGRTLCGQPFDLKAEKT